MRAILIPGFNDASEGADNIDKLKPYLEAKGYKVYDRIGDYGWKEIFGVWFNNESVARKLLRFHHTGDIYVGFSNGASILARAIDMGLPAKYCLFIHPALRADWEPPKNSIIERIDVYYSRFDNATRIAGWLQIITQPIASIKSIYWGRMGTTGPSSYNKIFRRHIDGCDHHSWARPPKLEECVKYVPRVAS